jgi:hypothetical protein
MMLSSADRPLIEQQNFLIVNIRIGSLDSCIICAPIAPQISQMAADKALMSQQNFLIVNGRTGSLDSCIICAPITPVE